MNSVVQEMAHLWRTRYAYECKMERQIIKETNFRQIKIPSIANV